MKISCHFILFCLFFLLTISSAYAETRYISDHLVVTVRSVKGKQYKVVERLPTSTPVQVLEEDQTYVKVLTKKGNKGYILKRYVTKTVPKIIIINQLNKKIEDLHTSSKNDVNTNDNQIKELSSQLDQAEQNLQQESEKYKKLLAQSKSSLSLKTENGELIEVNNLLNSELLVLREENQNFHRSNMIQWFLAGGGVFFFGWLIGKVSRKKQRRY